MTATLASPAELRAVRFEVLVAELRPLLRRSHPHLSEELLFEKAIYVAASRLAGGDMLWSVVGARMTEPQSFDEEYECGSVA
jgi:hypothetical protein